MLTQQIKIKEPVFYAIHTELRKDIARFLTIGDRWERLDESSFFQARDYMLFHFEALHAHHGMEDSFFFPAIQQKDQKLSGIIDTLEGQHHALVQSIEEITETLQQGRRAELSPRLQSYGNLVETHLNDEEDKLLTFAIDILKPEDRKEIEKKIDQTTSLTDRLGKLPWILDGMDDELQNTFFKQIPFFMPFVYRTFMKKKFETRVKVFEQFKS